VRAGAAEHERETPAFVRGVRKALGDERVGPVAERERPDGERDIPDGAGERSLAFADGVRGRPAFVGVSCAGPGEAVNAKACAVSESGVAAGGARSEPLSAASAVGVGVPALGSVGAGASARWRRQSGHSGTRQRMAG
jgi:hypothetical protein